MSPGLISTDESKASDILSTSLASSASSNGASSPLVSSENSSVVSSTVSSASALSGVSSTSTVSSASVEVSSEETSSVVSSTSPFTSSSLFSFSDIFTVPPNTNQYINLNILYYRFHVKTTISMNNHRHYCTFCRFNVKIAKYLGIYIAYFIFLLIISLLFSTTSKIDKLVVSKRTASSACFKGETARLESY